MATKRKKDTEINPIGEAVDEVLSSLPAEEVANLPQAEPVEQGQNGEPEKKKWVKPQNPFGFESIRGGENRVRLFKSEPEVQGDVGAWIIRFEKNPNEMDGYSKENPHPVLKMLKNEGFRWSFDYDGVGGWGKPFSGDPYGADHIEARRVLAKAAEMIGAPKEQSASR